MNLFNKLFKSGKTDESIDLTSITRTEVIEGVSIPGIIKNGQYFFTDIQVYSDGLISCWEMVDLAMFKDKVNKNWVVTSIPDGESISIHSLGNWIIEKGEWQHNKETLYEYIFSLVKTLNPTLENLHNYNGANSKMVGQAHIAKHFIPTPIPYHLDDPNSFLPTKINGDKFSIFYKDANSKVYLAELSIYKVGRVEITNIPSKLVFNINNLMELIDAGQIISSPKIGERVNILGLGSFIIRSGDGIDIKIKYQEFKDSFDELNGKENSIQRCARIFEEYKKQPSKRLRDELKAAYEDIPEHQRIYVGDMDTKDYEVRLIIYGDIVKKEWEENYDFEYPFEDIPKPTDE